MLVNLYRLQRNEQGQAVVEMALVLPVLLLILFGIVEFGRVFNAYLVVTQAAREGARLGAVGATDSEIVAEVQSASPTLDSAKVAVSISPAAAYRTRGQYITVAVEYPVKIIAPGLNMVLGDTFVVRSQTVMRVE